MKTTFKIGEISQFFDIPEPTLRYWEDFGILCPHQNKDNQYREYSVSDLMTISDWIFYRSLGISLKRIAEMEALDLSAQKNVITAQKSEIRKQQKTLEYRLEKLQHHLRALEVIDELQHHPYKIEKIDTTCIVSFELIEIQKLRQYIDNPYLYSRVQHSNDVCREARGLSVTDNTISDPSQLLWQDHHGKYVTFLMKEKIVDSFPNDLQDHLRIVQAKYHTGYIISRFLTNASENNQSYDYYKTFVEILK